MLRLKITRINTGNEQVIDEILNRLALSKYKTIIRKGAIIKVRAESHPISINEL